jgi:hypothetical protein
LAGLERFQQYVLIHSCLLLYAANGLREGKHCSVVLRGYPDYFNLVIADPINVKLADAAFSQLFSPAVSSCGLSLRLRLPLTRQFLRLGDLREGHECELCAGQQF